MNESSKKADLIEQAKSLGLDTSGKKNEIVQRIESYIQRHSLSDDNFTTPKYTHLISSIAPLPPCYPEVYEGLLGIEELRQKNMMLTAPTK